MAKDNADILGAETPPIEGGDNARKFAGEVLRAYVERLERFEEEIKTLNDDKRDVYAEAKGNGFDVKAIRAILRMRRQDPNERAEQDTILETYMLALGML